MPQDGAILTAIGKLGYTKLKNEQLSAIKGFVSGKDVFVSLPTGYGKSLIYGVLPLVFNFMKGMLHIIISESTVVLSM